MSGLFSALDELSRVLGADLAKAFLDHRRLLKKPMTPHAAQLMASRLEAMPNPKGCVEQSLINGWSNVYPVKEDDHRHTNGAIGRPSPGNMFNDLGDYYDAREQREGNPLPEVGAPLQRLPRLTSH